MAANCYINILCTKQNNAFKFKYYLVLARSYFEESSMKRKRKGKGKGIKENTLAFAFTENEYMYKVKELYI